jgi:hypothetical protein
VNAVPHEAGEPIRSALAGPRANAPLDEAIDAACARIAPSWPLDRFIAVNPFWGLVDAPVSEVAAKLRSLCGAELLMPRAYFREAHRRGLLRDEHLLAAIASGGGTESLASLRSRLEQEDPSPTVRARVVDLADAVRDLDHSPSWRGFVTQSISQFCAAFFDEGQATFGPDRDGGLFASWRRQAQRDRSPRLLMSASGYRSIASQLPSAARDMIALALEALGVHDGDRDTYLWSLLLDVNGWASWCAYLRWSARLTGKDDDTITELLAIRVAWEWILYRLGDETLAGRWKVAMAAWTRADETAARARAGDWYFQEAMEIAWRAPVLDALPQGVCATRVADASVQAVFCIDVRSEVFRRALEAVAPTVQTLGFAGFFGIPLEYRPLGAAASRPHLPGLLAPRVRAEDTGLEPGDATRRAGHLDLAARGKGFRTDPLAAFTFVEALGLTYAADLFKASFGIVDRTAGDRVGLSTAAEAKRRPRLIGAATGQPLDLEAQCDLALGMLRGMSLTRDFARLILLVGHGSATRNNPHAAGLDCGACCGQTGEVSARAGAALLNDARVREALARRGVEIPPATRFVAALHNTTTDDVVLFELDDVPESHRAEVETLRASLADASARARAERSGRLGLSGLDRDALARAVDARTKDWAQVRPEWGLANNAAFIVAPREHCRHLDLGGRAFLHEYRHREDVDHAVLELIMTAPMVVTHWINFQYYASTVDNARYGSGNKVLHNVVGGHVGVFEGNTGDLRIGLPLQSLHDGNDWVHTPLRLSVFIEAPRPAIDAILAKHPTVRALVGHGWISLFQLDEDEGAIHALRGAAWHRIPTTQPSDSPADP